MLIHSPKELALLIISQRKKLKLSQADVGRRVGLKQQTISEFEIKPEGTKLNTLKQRLIELSQGYFLRRIT
jgi:HTH-type transcriptional regulator/antitoxin HipB